MAASSPGAASPIVTPPPHRDISDHKVEAASAVLLMLYASLAITKHLVLLALLSGH